MHHQSGIKILFGILYVTRRSYITLTVLAAILFASLWVFIHTVIGPTSLFGRDVLTLFPYFYQAIDGVMVCSCVGELFEIRYYLRKFREREEFLIRERGAINDLDVNPANYE